MDQGFLSKVKDEEVPKMLFLSVNPNKVEEKLEAVSSATYTDGGAVGVGCLVGTGDFSPDGASDSIARLLEKFREALEEESIAPVRRELQLRILKLSSMDFSKNSNQSTLESNFSDENDELSNDEEDVLEFTEIFEMFGYQAPENIWSNFGKIISSKKIPVKREVSFKKKTFFVYAENKIIMQICNDLSPKEVFDMYGVLRESKVVDRDEKIKDLWMQPIDIKSLEKVAGLKDVAFYYLILNLMRKQLLNRLYTHRLCFIFHQLKQMSEGMASCGHIKRILVKLDRYPIASRPPGLCLIFIMTKTRECAHKDLHRVRELFEKVFMYDVYVKVDPKAEDIKSIVGKLKAARNKFYDSLVVWFMGHGSKTFLDVDNGSIHRRTDFIEPFTNIEWFFKKPKLFFIQACAVKNDRKRFSSSSTAPDMKSLSMNTDTVAWKAPAGTQWQNKYADYTDFSNINNFADTLISYATIWYQYASRNKEGSLYVDTLVDQLREYGSKESIENVLRRVHYNVNTVSLVHNEQGEEIMWKQAPYFESSLQKEFIFPNTQ